MCVRHTTADALCRMYVSLLLAPCYAVVVKIECVCHTTADALCWVLCQPLAELHAV